MVRALSMAGAAGWLAVTLPAASQAPAAPTPPPVPVETNAPPAAKAAVLPPEAEKSREAFEARIRDTDRRAAQLAKTLGAAYSALLKDLRASLQIAGRVRDMAMVHDELDRFTKERTIPAVDAIKEPAELRRVVEQLAAQARDETHANEVEVVDAAARHLQTLGTLSVQLALGERGGALSAVETERDRVIVHPRLRSALALSAAVPNRAVLGPAAAEAPPVDAALEIRKLRMYSPAGEDAGRVMSYSIDAAMWEDRTRMYQSKTAGSPKLGQSQTTSGPVSYKFRITIACRNGEIPPDCRLVVEYFRRSLTESDKSYLSAEELKLPPIARNESRTFEIKGVEMTQSETRSTTLYGSNRTLSGHELHGMIVSLLDPSGRVLLQRFTPQSLGKDTVPTPGKR